MSEHRPMKPSLDGIVRCEGCDETWPCEVTRLRAANKYLTEEIARLRERLGMTGGPIAEPTFDSNQQTTGTK